MIQVAIISISIGLLSFITIMMAAQLIDAMATIKPHEVFESSAVPPSSHPPADQLAGQINTQSALPFSPDNGAGRW